MRAAAPSPFALATLSGNELTLSAGLVSLDGQQQITDTVSGPKAEADRLGTELGEKILAAGAKELLAEIRGQQAEEGI